ncbi:uncharacterized protein LOC136027831 isoform X2 [Artemia franciscana]|uniref:uncharacterized protein LOC136027831 isoform X2 n=1 Tax=Artemia franciscana TaxID=6661 RepID=UPI0032DACFAB
MEDLLANVPTQAVTTVTTEVVTNDLTFGNTTSLDPLDRFFGPINPDRLDLFNLYYQLISPYVFTFLFVGALVAGTPPPKPTTPKGGLPPEPTRPTTTTKTTTTTSDTEATTLFLNMTTEAPPIMLTLSSNGTLSGVQNTTGGNRRWYTTAPSVIQPHYSWTNQYRIPQYLYSNYQKYHH